MLPPGLGWSISDIILIAQYTWKIYESFDGQADSEFERFKGLFQQIVECLKRLQANSSHVPVADATIRATLKDCERFIKAHRHLAGEAVGPRTSEFSERLKKFAQKATWPVYREEAERLRTQLIQGISVLNLDFTTRIHEDTTTIKGQSEDMTRAVKLLIDKINLILKRVAPSSDSNVPELDLGYVEHLGPHNMSLSQPNRALETLDSDDILQIVQRFSTRLESLSMREAIGRNRGHESTARSHDSDLRENVQSVLKLLDSARIIANVALIDAGLPSLPSQPRTQDLRSSIRDQMEASNEPSETLHEATKDWDGFGQWLRWHMLHDNSTTVGRPSHAPGSPRIDVDDAHLSQPSPSLDSTWSSPSPMATTPVTVGSGSAEGHRTRYGSIDIGYPGFNAPRTRYRVRVEFPDPERRATRQSPVEGYLEICSAADGSVEALRTVNTDENLTVYHTPSHDSRTHSASPFLPWIDNSHVVPSSATSPRLQFKGSHHVSVKDKRHRTDIRHKYLNPVYVFRSVVDFQDAQNRLMGKKVLASFDVVTISSRAASDDQCNSETLRILEDEDNQKSLLYYARRATTRTTISDSGFTEWSISDFEETKKTGKKEVKLIFRLDDDLPRRSTTGSLSSIFSFQSTQSNDSAVAFQRRRSKTLKIEFYEEEDRKTFQEIWKPAATPVFNETPFGLRDVGVGSSL